MIPSPDTGFVYPKTGLDVDLRMDLTPRFVSTGSALFDGSDDFVNCGDHVNSQMASGDFSIVYWTKNILPDSTGDEDFVVSKQDGASDYDGYRFGQDDGVTVFSLRVDGSNNSGYVKGNTKINDGVWHHIAFTVDRSGNLLGYVDGQLDKTTDISSISGSIDPDEDLILGASYAGTNQNYTGNLCNVGIYKGTALTQAQVRSIMGATTYAQTAAVVTPSLFYLLAADYTDSTGNQDGTNSGSTLVGDRARLPNGYDLSMTAGVPNQMSARCFSGRAIALDGTGDYIDVDGMQWDSTGAWSVSWWTKMVGAAVANRKAWGFRSSSASDRWNFSICRSGDVNQFGAYNDDGSSTEEIELGSNLPLFDSQWHHLVFTVTGGTSCRLYMDGLLVSADGETISQSADMSAADEGAIGAAYNGTGADLAVEICDWKVVAGTAWSAAQVLEQYQNPEMILPTGVTTSHLKQYLPLSDYDISGANNLDGLYVQDASGNGKHGLMANGGATFSIPNIPQLGLRSSSSRLYFDQDDDKVTVGNNAAINGLFTSGGSIALWVNIFSDGEGTYGRMIETAGYKFFVQSESSGNVQVRFDHTWDTNGTWVGPAASIALGAWNHLVVTYNGSSIENDPVIYINGSSVTVAETVKPVAPINADTGDKVFGADPAGVRTTHGIISEIAYYKGTILDADAVTVMYNGGVQGLDLLSDSGNYDNAADVDGWWKLDNPVTIQDLTANDNDGTVSGTPAMATIPEGPTDGISTMGSLTQTSLGTFTFNTDGTGYASLDDGGTKALNPVTAGWSMSVWFRMINLGNGNSTIILDRDTGNDRWHLKVRDDAGDTIQFNFSDGSGKTDIDGPAVTDNDWHHVGITLDYGNDIGRIFVDGAKYGGDVDISGRTADCPADGMLGIGGNAGADQKLFGAVGGLKIYNATLADNVMLSLYQSGIRFVKGDS